jgi:hypothetical protein
MAAATLTCKQCGHVNEAERVYCHNCGSKLDRSLLPEETKSTPKTSSQERRRVQKLTTPARGFFVGGWLSFAYVIFWALLLSAVVEMARKPDGIPPVPGKDELTDTPPLATLVEEKMRVPVAQKLSIDEALINKYLAVKIKAQPGGLLSGVLKFDRAFANLSDGAARITIQHSLFGYPLFVSSIYKPAVSGGQFTATNLGGNIGRLPVHPMLMERSGFLFDSLWDAFKEERGLLEKMKSVDVQKDKPEAGKPEAAKLVLVTKPPPRK